METKTQKSNSENIIEQVKENIEKETGEDWEYLAEPKHIKVLKIIAILIAILIFAFLIYNNFIISKTFTYFYDIGEENENYLSPNTRISEIIEGNPNYRNLTEDLVYFNIPIAGGSETINIQIRLKDNFPNETQMSLGAKDQEVWHYLWNQIYNPSLEGLSEFKHKNNIYQTNKNIIELILPSLEQLKQKQGITIATNSQYNPIPNIIEDYKEKQTIISTALRGKHLFYVYAQEDLNLEVKKQDINWYEGEDPLEISLYDLENNLITNITIQDDGIINANKTKAMIQTGNLQTQNLPQGIYRLEFSDFDGLIREIKINTNKIISDRLFLADNELYGLTTKQTKIYTKINRDSQIKLMTYHSEGIQNVTYNNKTFNFYREDEPLYLDLKEGEYNLIFPKNDIIISNNYFSFSKENYFEPFKQKIIQIPNDFEYIKNNVDYLITNYQPPIQDNDGMITSTKFNIAEDNLVIKDNKLSLVFNTPHLSPDKPETNTQYIPIDWIKIEVYKPGLIEKLKRGDSFLEALT